MFVIKIIILLNMNKFYAFAFFIIVGLTFYSCKKHDTEIPTEPDYIIGEWKLDKLVIYGVEQDLTDCHKQSYMIFDSNHEAESKYYTIYANSGDCVLHLHYIGTWEYNEAENKFYFNVDSTNTSGNSTTNINKELHFTDTEHFYVIETYQGMEGKFFFEKQ